MLKARFSQDAGLMGEKTPSHLKNNVHFIKENILGASTLVIIRSQWRKIKVMLEKIQLKFRAVCLRVTQLLPILFTFILYQR